MASGGGRCRQSEMEKISENEAKNNNGNNNLCHYSYLVENLLLCTTLLVSRECMQYVAVVSGIVFNGAI